MLSSNQSSPISGAWALGTGNRGLLEPSDRQSQSPKRGESNKQDFVVARHRTYTLFGRLYLEGVTAVTLPVIAAIPELANALPAKDNADEAAAAHQSLFGFNVFPYESIFLDNSGLLGGTVTDAVLHSYLEAGFEVDAASTSPDHIGHEMEMLAHLCAAEADAWQDHLPAVVERMRYLARDFLANHLLRWLVPFVVAVREQKRPFYTALANLTLEFIHDHWQEISAPSAPLRLNNFLPNPPTLLDNEKAGLKEIASYLTTPPYSGFFLSRDDIARLARQQEIPRGFGDRTQMLTHLLRGAAQFDALPALLDTLQAQTAAWQEACTTSANEMPALSPFVAAWQDRLAQTGRLLTQIERQIEMATNIFVTR